MDYLLVSNIWFGLDWCHFIYIIFRTNQEDLKNASAIDDESTTWSNNYNQSEGVTESIYNNTLNIIPDNSTGLDVPSYIYIYTALILASIILTTAR